MARKDRMSGNEAVARGAYEAGVVFASAYPGTPSTEILENVANYKKDIYSEWAPNEKVAMEVAFGASLAGKRSFCAMKHVGLNVAMDAYANSALTGVRGGLVLLVAVNIVLGSLNALFDGSFDKVKLRNGIIKGIIVAACFIAFYMAGYLNPDIIAIEVDEQTVNLMTASNLALLTAYVLYAKDVFVKLKNLILSKTSGTPPEELAAEQETAE